jgi:hypothetical protein
MCEQLRQGGIMFLYDNQKVLTTVIIHSDDNEPVQVEEISQVSLDNGILILVNDQKIMTFDAFRYSIAFEHNVKAIKSLANSAEDQFWADHEKNNGVTH